MAKIFIVDDSLYMRKMLRHILTDAGFDIIGEAETGHSAIEQIKQNNPDLVTLDVILPDITGLEVLTELNKSGIKTKVILVSAVGQDVIINEGMSLGAKDYILKPFSEEKVVKTINKLLASPANS